ncbi:Serine/threonine-protein kinase CTR1 [Spatholobus suberectus]|nr:Serine/threonine-protein kinase CTR1 [Spatholobus suberectus]
MAFDQTSIPGDVVRPLNSVARSVAEEPLVLPATTAVPGAVPIFYPASVSDAGSVGMGYGNVASCGGGGAAATWCVRPAVPIHNHNHNHNPSVNPAVGFSHAPSFPNRVAAPGGNAVDVSGSFVAATHGYPMNLGGNWVAAGNGLDNNTNSNSKNNALRGNSRVIRNAGDHVGGVGVVGVGSNPPANQRVDQVSEEGGDDSVSGRKMKLMCSYGGKILPRPSDGMLRYVGGQTRIVSIKRDVSFNDLVQKMVNSFGQPVVIKYQLPGEDLDALVSVSCPDDLENMMEEYERLIERSADGSPKLRVFLFSASELDPSGVVQFVNLHDGGLKYVEAVNGITDGISGKLTRKASYTSAASTQNSDLSGIDAPDGSNAAQGDVGGVPVPMPSALSPEGSVAASHDATANSVVSEPGTSCTDASAVSLGIPVTNSGPTHAPPFQNEVELEKSIPVTFSQPQFGVQQSGLEIPPSAPLQPFVDPRQEFMHHADYVQLPPHMGFPNPQLLGKPGSIYSQHHDNTSRFGSHQVIPAVQMTMTQPFSHAGVRPSVVQPQPFMQPQQNRLDQYNDENTSGLRIHQLPAEQSYNAYPVQVPFGGNYGWVNVPTPEHVIFPDAFVPQQPVMIPEKVQRVEDCYMCQKKLPHAHSDPVVQDQRNSCAVPIPDSIPSFYGLPMENNSRVQATNVVLVTAPMKEDNFEQAVGTRPKVISKLDTPAGVPCADSAGLSLEPEGERLFIQKLDWSDHPRNAVIQEAVVRTGEKQSPSDGQMGTALLSYRDDIALQHMVPVENWVREDSLVNKYVNNDIPLVGGTSVENSDCMVQECPTEYTNELASTISKADAVENWIAQGLLKPIDGRMDNPKMGNPQIFLNNDKFDYSTQHAVEKKGLVPDNNPGKSKLIGDANQINMMDMLPSSTVEISSGNNSRPVEYNEVTQPSVWGIPGSNPQSKSGNHQKDDAVLSSVPPFGRFGDVQDSSNSLFSNQDLWNIHSTYFPPPRPNKVAVKKDTNSNKDQFGENPGNSGEQNFEAQIDNGLYQTFKQNLTLEEARSAKVSSEDRQLQAVAEGLAASVLHSSTSSNLDLHARDVSHHEDVGDGDVQNNLIDIQDKDKAQDLKSKLPEKANFGFPASDVGALQVIKNCDLEELIELGSGTFGTVYHGKWRGTDVAIKRINDRCFAGKPSEQERLRADFWNEAIKLADLHHPNVVAFYGVVLDGPGGSVATVTEYMVNGSLRNALQKNGRNLDKRKRLLIAMDVAFGMEYLHGKNIVHFDLKSDNLLVNLRDPHRPICKVGDLGLSKVKCQTLISGGVRGTLPWMAPELLNGSSSLVSEKVDVFSFGIVMWELLTGEEPYADLHYGAIIGGIVNNTLRPPVPESCDPEWRLLMERCWSSEPSERPSFTEIANGLRSMATKISPKGQNQQQQPASSQSQVQK